MRKAPYDKTAVALCPQKTRCWVVKIFVSQWKKAHAAEYVLCRLMNQRLLFSKVKTANLLEIYLACQNNTVTITMPRERNGRDMGHGVRWIPDPTVQ